MELLDSIKEEALEHAKKDFPKESVGLVHIVKGKQRYFPCKNQATDPEKHFVLDPADYLEAEKTGAVTAVIHSHPTTNHAPSEADKVACEKSKLPWFIVNPQTENWGEYEPSGFELPYVGRQWSHGIVDCYTLIRDFYKREFKIELKDYNRQDDWWLKGQNLYVDNFKKEGFKEIGIEEAKYGDLFLMTIQSPVVNHGSIYLGENLVLHHVQGRLSSRDVYKWGGYYFKATALGLRHESR